MLSQSVMTINTDVVTYYLNRFN